MRVDFFFDPSCPWTWVTSRWVVEVAPERDLDVAWRAFSLAKLHGEDGSDIPDRFSDAPDDYRSRLDGTLGVLRVVEALRARGELDQVGELYTEWGMRKHHDGEPASLALVERVGVACGIGAEALAAARDPRWDAAIEASMDEAIGFVGPEFGVPALVFDIAPRCGIFGPIVSPAPTGDDALRLWDAVVTLATECGFFELKRARADRADVGARP